MTYTETIRRLDASVEEFGSAPSRFFNSFTVIKNIAKSHIEEEIRDRRSFYELVAKRLHAKGITNQDSLMLLSYLEMLQVAIEALEVKAGIKDTRKLKAAALHMSKKMQSSVH